ncbi:MAG: hypothetical protein M1398_07960 [Deltaproteobacteria bacterium]|jgi:hypothetical protein|nr:hypothetical protein [Deltaproteobacteria bacterium]
MEGGEILEGTLHVYQDANLTKQLKALLKGGANGAPAARHAQTIIDRFVEAGLFDPRLMGRLTRYGDARIKNCIKFDLVRGYRLVAALLDHGIAFLYVGSHDECDHWLKNNAGLKPILSKKRNRVVAAGESAAVEILEENELEMNAREPDYDERLLRNITEKDLRKIFCGLCKKRYDQE